MLASFLPLQVQIALDESPLPYFPRTKGSYTVGQTRRVPVAQSSDKRQITCTPMVSAAGELVSMQLIWRGTSRRCHGSGLYHPAVFQQHSGKKMQNRATFAELLKDLRKKVTDTLVRDNLTPSLPMVVIVDNVSSHVLETMVPCQGVKTAAGLWRVDSGTYLFFTLANRSHTLNVGDQTLNLVLRSHLKRSSKMFVLQHSLEVARGLRLANSKLDIREQTMKEQLRLWLNNFIADPRLVGWIKASWASAHTVCKPQTCLFPHCFFLPSGLTDWDFCGRRTAACCSDLPGSTKCTRRLCGGQLGGNRSERRRAVRSKRGCCR